MARASRAVVVSSRVGSQAERLKQEAVTDIHPVLRILLRLDRERESIRARRQQSDIRIKRSNEGGEVAKKHGR